MNKKIVSLVIFISLFCLVGVAFGEGITDPLGGQDFPTLFGNIATKVGELIAGIGTIMFVVSGILYIGSTANPDLRATAKKALMYAIVGMFIGLAATAIVSWVQQVAGS